MILERVLNPEWENAPYEYVYFWEAGLPKWKRDYYERMSKELPRYQDPECKIAVPKYIIKTKPEPTK